MNAPPPDPSLGASNTPPIAGILVIDKPLGFTSMDVCAIVRGKLRRAGAPKNIKVGHGGTLDPAATGVLVVLVGRATRLCDRVMVGEKEYEARIDLSRTSDTDDLDGDVRPAASTRVPTRDELGAAAEKFIGDILQRPPAYSAVHVGGRRAYDLARKGQDVVLPERPVRVDEFEIRDFTWPVVHARVRCGKGVYVRSLARDLGAALGVGGVLAALRRTRVGRFTIDHARALDSLPTPLSPSELDPIPDDLTDSPRT